MKIVQQLGTVLLAGGLKSARNRGGFPAGDRQPAFPTIPRQKRAEELLFLLIQYRGRITLSFETGDVELSRYESDGFAGRRNYASSAPASQIPSFSAYASGRIPRFKCRCNFDLSREIETSNCSFIFRIFLFFKFNSFFFNS